MKSNNPPQTSLLPPSERYGRQSNIYEMKQAMARLWTKMAVLFGTTWTRQNGDIDGATFNGWMTELQRLGPAGIERGIQSVKAAGSNYAPNLNSFLKHCRDAQDSGSKTGLSLDEERYGKLKPTPNGVPLSWTTPPYAPCTEEELRASGHPEDEVAANRLSGRNWS